MVVLQEVSQLGQTVQSLQNISSDPEYLPFSPEQVSRAGIYQRNIENSRFSGISPE